MSVVIAPIPNLALSNGLRMSLVGWSKSLAREVARKGVIVNIVLPGRIATDRIRFLDEQKAKREGRSVTDVAAESTASIPVGRYGDPPAGSALCWSLDFVMDTIVSGRCFQVICMRGTLGRRCYVHDRDG